MGLPRASNPAVAETLRGRYYNGLSMERSAKAPAVQGDAAACELATARSGQPDPRGSEEQIEPPPHITTNTPAEKVKNRPAFVMGGSVLHMLGGAGHNGQPASDKSLYVFAPDNVLRVVLFRMRSTVSYGLFMAAATLACALFVFLRPKPSSWMLHAADIVFGSVFVLDVAFGTIAFGWIKFWRHDHFNKIDVVTSFLFLVDIALHTLGFSYSLRSMRLFRIFKPMLSLKAFAGIRAIFLSVVDGASSLGAILFILALALLVITVVGVEFYKGSALRRCVWMDSLEEVVPMRMCKVCECMSRPLLLACARYASV